MSYTAAIAAIAAFSLQGCKKNEDMASLVDQAKTATAKDSSKTDNILKTFKKDVKGVPEVKDTFTPDQHKKFKVDQINTDLQAMYAIF